LLHPHSPCLQLPGPGCDTLPCTRFQGVTGCDRGSSTFSKKQDICGGLRSQDNHDS
jgi:hypothetical protein